MAFPTSIARWLQGGMASDGSLQLLGQSGNTAITIPASGSFWEVVNFNLNVWTANANSTFDVEVVGLR